MSTKKWHLAGFIFILISGVLLHYAYDFFECSTFVGYFAPVNESVWEHLKLVFWPAFLFSVLEYVTYGKKEADFFSVKMSAIFAALLCVVTLFYTYTGVLGFNFLGVDIAIFVVSVFLCQWLSLNLLSRESFGDASDNFRCFVVLLLFALCFVIWTTNPPAIGIFWG